MKKLGIISDMSLCKPYFDTLYGETTEEQLSRYEKNFAWFKKSFKKGECYVASSSGRVEVCGNHTDHQGGKVVCTSISLDTLAMFLPTDDGVIRIKSEGYNDIVIDTNGDTPIKLGTSSAIVKGVVVGMKNRGFKVGGFVGCFTSNVLNGAGISSSASFECLVTKILGFLYNDDKVEAEDIAKISQYSENEFFGKPCGLLDQSAIAFGGIAAIDFSDKNKIQVEKIDNPLSDYTLVLIDTGSDHANLTAEYAAVPAEMKAVAKFFKKERLSEVKESDFYAHFNEVRKKTGDRPVLRAEHYYNEIRRVEELTEGLKNEKYDVFLRSINESGLSSLYVLQNCVVAGKPDQSVPVALTLAKRFLKNGANRIHGGGFAGTILNVVENDNLPTFIEEMKKFYKEKAIIPLKVRKIGTTVL